MGDLGLFGLGLLIGVLAPVGALAPIFGLVLGPALVLALPIMAGVRDGKRHLRLRWVWSWAPALLGLFVFPLFLVSIFKEQLYGPRAAKSDVTLLGVLAVLSAVAAVVVAVTIAVSVVTRTRRLRHTSDHRTISEQFGGPDEA